MYSSTRGMDGHHTLSQIPRVCFDRCESHAGLRLPTVMLRPAAASSATTARRTVQPRCGFSLRHHLLCCPKRLPMPPAATTCLLTKAPPHKAAAAPRMSPSQTGRTSSPHGHAAHNHREEVFSAYDWRSALHHDDHDWTSTLTLARQIEHHRGRSDCRRKGKSRIFNSTTMQLICSRAWNGSGNDARGRMGVATCARESGAAATRGRRGGGGVRERGATASLRVSAASE
jgi:hypothetical protein